jgi:hypothetical protein
MHVYVCISRVKIIFNMHSSSARMSLLQISMRTCSLRDLLDHFDDPKLVLEMQEQKEIGWTTPSDIYPLPRTILMTMAFFQCPNTEIQAYHIMYGIRFAILHPAISSWSFSARRGSIPNIQTHNLQ